MMTMVISGSDGVTFPDSTTQNTTDRYGFVNRIINGDMRIDQRNAGAAITINSASNTYSVDRFFGRGDTSDGVFTLDQTTTVPAGFTNSVLATVTTADASIGATQRYQIGHRIEGFNVADLGWGTASAKTVTLSFWVRSSLTGTFGGALTNSAADRSYPFSYSISVANTWEQKSVTIAGDTTGTWLTDSGIGIQLLFSLGAGSTYLGTAGSWAATLYTGATGQTQVIGTLNATWYVTGVQLEVGSVATPFERRPYGTELALCQRYYYKISGSGTGTSTLGVGFNTLTTAGIGVTSFPVTMRDRPTALEQSGTAGDYVVAHANTATACSAVPTFAAGTTKESGLSTFTVASGLTAGQGSRVASASNNSSAYLAWSAEL
jgi:hypothetical protein